MGIDHSAEIDAAPEELWAQLSRPGAIHRLIPPWQPMTVVREAANLRDGTAKLRVAGAPWTSQHLQDGYVDGEQFVDELTSFPLRLVSPWRHEHRVQAAADGRSVMSDRVITPVPAAVLRATFEYRHRQLAGDLAAHATCASRPLTVAVTGASGLIGSQLTALLTTGGHRVIRLVRHPASGADERQWDTDNPADSLLNEVDAVVHLAGTGIAGRFTKAHKKAVRNSRIGPTRRLAEVAAAAGVGTFVSASGIGIYGADRGDEQLDETALHGDDFLAELVVDWEADSATVAAAASRLRAVQVRTGIVVTPGGGFLKQLRPLFALGVGGRVGSGEQWLSWIGIDDLLDIYLRVLTDTTLSGPVNAVAPNPVRNKEFTSVFGHVLHRPTIVPVPSFGPKLLLGTEGAAEVAEASQRVTPAVLERAGHRFRNPDLESALRHVMGKSYLGSVGR